MAAALRLFGLKSKEPKETLGALAKASFVVAFEAAPKGGAKKPINPMVPTNKLANSIGTSSSHTADSSTIQSTGFSDPTESSFSQSSLASSPKDGIQPGKSQLSDKEELGLNSNADFFAKLHDEPVAELSGRVTDVSIRPVFEGGYSNVWTGKLNGTQEVNGLLLVRSPLLMIRRLQLNVFETSLSEKRRQEG
jgi:hypothetical protein